MKKSILALFIAAALFAGCQKDTSTKVTLTSADLTVISAQLKGTWLFPAETLSIVDSTGKSLQPNQNLPLPALQFDGSSKVNIMPDEKTVIKGTYAISTVKGNIYVDIVYPDGTTLNYMVVLIDNQSLKMTSTQPYVYYVGNKAVSAQAVTTASFKKQSSADASSNMLRVTVQSDSLFNVGVYITHPGDTTQLVGSQQKVTGSYGYSCLAKSGDKLKIDVLGSLTKTAVNAYYNGLPFGAGYELKAGEIVTSGDWVIH